jgi:hypothetical protein
VGQDAASERHHCRNTNVSGHFRVDKTKNMDFDKVKILIGATVDSSQFEKRDIESLIQSGSLTAIEISDQSFVNRLNEIYTRKNVFVELKSYEEVAQCRQVEWKLLTDFLKIDLKGAYRTSHLRHRRLTYMIIN